MTFELLCLVNVTINLLLNGKHSTPYEPLLRTLASLNFNVARVIVLVEDLGLIPPASSGLYLATDHVIFLRTELLVHLIGSV